MVFPATPLPIVVELFLNGAWTDLTGLFYSRDPLQITRGQSAEGAEVERSLCRATADNRTGNLSPRNPTGIYYGQLTRNTPMRVRLSSGAPPGYLLQHDDGRANTPDSASLSITGDIDVRVDIRPEHWDRQQGLCNKVTNPSQRSWALGLNADSTLSWYWTTDGSTIITKTSTAAVSPPASGRLSLRVTLDVNVGGTTNEVKFYTSTDIDLGTATWTQLGATVSTAGTTSIFDSTANVEIGASQGFGGADDLTGRLYEFELYASLDGTSKRADVKLSEEEPGPGPFTDASGNVWTLAADASIVRPDIRSSGEVSEFPARWDKSRRDVTVPIEASGVLRRLTQGASPLASTLRRGYSRLSPQPKAYWPCEDGTDATQIASALPGHPAMTIQAGANPLPSFASFEGFKCSGALPTFNGTQWTGIVPPYTVPSPAVIQVFFLARIPSGSLDEEGIMAVYTTGTAQRWSILYDSAGSGNLRIIATDTGGAEVLNNSIAFGVNNKLIRVDLELSQNGANVDWALETLEVGASAIVGLGGTVNSVTIGRCTAVVANAGADHTGIAVGHISVHDSIRDLFGLAAELNAYDGETAARRVARLCSEEGVTFRLVGDADAASPMGPQLQGTLVDLLRECAEADGGLLYEPRDLFGLSYRVREDLYNQAAALALDYDAKQISAIEPTEDDQTLRNDITVQRTGGASARAVKETGTLSVLAPPAGVGRYDEQVELNLQSDSQVADMAGWRLLLGAIDEARYPSIGIDLASSAFAASTTLTAAALDLEMGDRLTVDDLPAWMPPDLVAQLAIGFIETMSHKVHAIGVVCQPATPFDQAGVYEPIGGIDTRYSSDGTTTTEALDTTETGVDVTTPSGPSWRHDDGDYDIVIGGERMTVTAVTGAGAAQTLTVTRSTNGVVKSHVSGATVDLFRPAVYVP